MRRNLIAGFALAAVAAVAVGATTVFGSGPAVVQPAQVSVPMRGDAAPALGRSAAAKKASKPKVVYLGGSGSLNTADTGAYIDFGLKAPKNLCPRVIDGGVKATNLDFFQQGSYVDKGVYHVLMGLDDGAMATPVTIEYTTHLICLKGVR